DHRRERQALPALVDEVRRLRRGRHARDGKEQCRDGTGKPQVRGRDGRAGAINGAIAVAAGAFAAHALKSRLDARALEVFETGARYQMYHALAIVLCGLLAMTRPGWVLQV